MKDEELLDLTPGNYLDNRQTPTERTPGVGFLTNKRGANSITKVTSVSDRVPAVTVQLRKRYMSRESQTVATRTMCGELWI